MNGDKRRCRQKTDDRLSRLDRPPVKQQPAAQQSAIDGAEVVNLHRDESPLDHQTLAATAGSPSPAVQQLKRSASVAGPYEPISVLEAPNGAEPGGQYSIDLLDLLVSPSGFEPETY
jgi:hypothetical protein